MHLPELTQFTDCVQTNPQDVHKSPLTHTRVLTAVLSHSGICHAHSWSHSVCSGYGWERCLSLLVYTPAISLCLSEGVMPLTLMKRYPSPVCRCSPSKSESRTERAATQQLIFFFWQQPAVGETLSVSFLLFLNYFLFF